MNSLTWSNDPKNSRLAPASNSVTKMKVDGAASVLNFKGLGIFNTYFKYINQTWLVKDQLLMVPFFSFSFNIQPGF
jgi:hypothetical protein